MLTRTTIGPLSNNSPPQHANFLNALKLPDNLLNFDGSAKSNDQKKRKSGFENKKGNRITKVILREIRRWSVFVIKVKLTHFQAPVLINLSETNRK